MSEQFISKTLHLHPIEIRNNTCQTFNLVVIGRPFST
jgi:hypothetical protein